VEIVKTFDTNQEHCMREPRFVSRKTDEETMATDDVLCDPFSYTIHSRHYPRSRCGAWAHNLCWILERLARVQ